MAVTLNASTSTGYIQTADTSGDLALQSNGTTQFTVASTGAYGQLKASTAVTASGIEVAFTSIPSWVKRITVMLAGVSTNSTGAVLIQVGSGSYSTSGYLSSCAGINSGTGQGGSTSGLVLTTGPLAAASNFSGAITLSLINANQWVSSGNVQYTTATGAIFMTAGYTPALSGALDRLRLYIDGTQQFDAGTINILYEG